MFSSLRVLVQIAFRNLFASRLKTVIVGGIIFFGALLVTLGSSMLDSVTSGMSRSIIGTASGDIQIYSSKSKDELALFGGMGGEPDLAQIDDFEKVKQTLETVPNVKTVVPMGISGALVTSGNTVDLVLERLRNAVRKKVAGDQSPAVEAQIQAQKAHVQQIVTLLESNLQNAEAIRDQRTVTAEDLASRQAVTRAASPKFWEGFDRDPLSALEFLENRIAPQVTDADLLYIRYLGTDPDQFKRSFDRFRIVEGTSIPEGHRGFLFSKFFYEERLKLHAARRLDKIREGLDEKGLKIATDADLQRMVRENTQQLQEIVLQLDSIQTQQLRERLQRELGTKDAELSTLLSSFFATDDDNFKRRYKFFYDQIAPMLELYRIRIGDTFTIRAFTKTGYSQSVNLRVYGVFDFEGLEKSPLAGSLNLMDLVSFRDLYGFLTADKVAEIQSLKKAAGFKNIDRENAEADLFGAGSHQVVADATPGLGQDATLPDLADEGARLHREDLVDRIYKDTELQRGVVLNAAVILKDPRKVRSSIQAIEAAAKRDGLDLRALSWQDAAGLIGNLVLVFRVVLYVSVLIIFLVALVIINNALVMATLERVREIGTLRAVGAQRTFILGMLVIEAVTTGLVFGALGALAGVGIIELIGLLGGLPATSDVLFFFYSGPRLFPFIAGLSLIAAFAIVVVVSAASSFYPAWLAMRVTPRQAMASED